MEVVVWTYADSGALELTFNEGDTITNIEFPDEDWWVGNMGADQGLFPANYVQLNQ